MELIFESFGKIFSLDRNYLEIVFLSLYVSIFATLVSAFVSILIASHMASTEFLGKNIIKLDPMTYQDMVFAINNSKGLISDSGGLQEEAICLNKNILICRDTSERPETIDSGFGKLIGSDILNNIQFLENGNTKDIVENPYGKNVVKKILEVLSD